MNWSTILGMVLLVTSSTNLQADTILVGSGSIAEQANPEGYICTNDNGSWIHNAGVVEPAITGCDDVAGPIGTPTPLLPHLTGPAAQKHTGTHRWWGSVSFYGEMPIGDSSKAGYITPDPISARLSDRGFRVGSIPGGMKSLNSGHGQLYEIPDPFSEVFDGLGFVNSQYQQMTASLYDYSDGSVTVEWRQEGAVIMRATFVHGSPYVFIRVLKGQLEIKSKAASGAQKGIYYQAENELGIWTDVASNRATYLIVGDDGTEFTDIDSQSIGVISSTGRVTIALLPVDAELPDSAMIDQFAQYAGNHIDELLIDYQVDRTSNEVTVQHHYLNQGQAVKTLAGLMPLQWKNAATPVNSEYSIRSARGTLKFAPLSEFAYELPFVGVLPSLPALQGSYDEVTLKQFIDDFIGQGQNAWNSQSDTYWAGKNYGKVAELAALAHSHGLVDQYTTLIAWLKGELEDWFTAQTNGVADKSRYFSYDDQWNTLLGYNESYGSQQQLNDHHFHYGYFVRAAAEICRTDKSWCAAQAWGGMVEMLIRDYAASRNDSLFPYARNFDPANGFSWASGHANYVLGNNNESTSEAANAYGAIVLYGLITGNEELTDHGIYLHASSTAAYWEYWNNIDRYRGLDAEYDNFIPQYDKLSTSIIWGNGHVFATWFSAAYAHILGIQGLPMNPLVMHIGQHADYLKDYVELGLSESSNGKPSGLSNDQWRDVWWNIWAMTDPEATIDDFNSMNFNYDVEAGETVAHTYHWIHSFKTLGHLRSGSDEFAADYPAALVFEKNGQLTYVAYNFDDIPRLVTFSDGMAISLSGNSFGIKQSGDTPDVPLTDQTAPSRPGVISVSNLTSTSATLHWGASSDDVAVVSYDLVVSGDIKHMTSTQEAQASISGLTPKTTYQVEVTARDSAGNVSSPRSGSFTTLQTSASCSDFCFVEENDRLIITVGIGKIVDLHYKINNGTQMNVRMVPMGSGYRYEIANLVKGDNVEYFFTVIDGTAHDTDWHQRIFGADVVETPDTTTTIEQDTDDPNDVSNIADGVYQIKSKKSGLCLDVLGGFTAQATRIIQWQCHDGNNQRWAVSATGDGQYKLLAMHSGLAMDVDSASARNGAAVQQWLDNGTQAQRFKIEDLGNREFRLINGASGKSLNIEEASTEAGARLQQWDWNGGDHQRFYLVADTVSRLLGTTMLGRLEAEEYDPLWREAIANSDSTVLTDRLSTIRVD
jgi:endoglucanase Acf2